MPEQPTILIVDDDPFVLESLQEYLEEANYRVVAASDGRAALAAIREQPADLALLDMKMPEMDGFQVASALRQVRPSIRVIMFTGYPSVDSEAQAAQQQFYDFLPKSNWYDLLLPTLERVIEAEARPAPVERPADLHTAAEQYIQEGKFELAANALERAARLAEFEHDWNQAADLYTRAFESMRRARGLSWDAKRLRDLADGAQLMAQETR